MFAPLFATSPTAEIQFYFGTNGLSNLLHLFSSRYKLSESDEAENLWKWVIIMYVYTAPYGFTQTPPALLAAQTYQTEHKSLPMRTNVFFLMQLNW